MLTILGQYDQFMISGLNRVDWLKRNSITLELATIAVFLLILLSNFMIIQYAEGYFGYYHIPLAEMNFAPQMYDYIRIATPVLLATVIVIATGYGLSAASDRLAKKLADKLVTEKLVKTFFTVAKKRERLLRRTEYILGFFLKILNIGLLIYIVLTMGSIVAPKIGSGAAEAQSKYSSISNDGELSQDVIIYKNGDEIVLKSYNTRSRKFEVGYRVLVGDSYTVRPIYK